MVMQRQGLSSHTSGLTVKHRYRSGSARLTCLITQGELGSCDGIQEGPAMLSLTIRATVQHVCFVPGARSACS